MRADDLRAFYDYTYWATHKLLAVVAQLTPDQFTQQIAGSYGSIRNTLVHTMSAEWGWLDRCGGHTRGPKLDPAKYPTPASLVDEWTRVEGFVREFLSTLTDDDVDRIIEFSLDPAEPRSLKLGQLMHHGAVHGVHHRGQVALMLRMIGVAPGNFDLVVHDMERQAGVRG
jgi:uncharacterized damage-inducible protein DinB